MYYSMYVKYSSWYAKVQTFQVLYGIGWVIPTYGAPFSAKGPGTAWFSGPSRAKSSPCRRRRAMLASCSAKRWLKRVETMGKPSLNQLQRGVGRGYIWVYLFDFWGLLKKSRTVLWHANRGSSKPDAVKHSKGATVSGNCCTSPQKKAKMANDPLALRHAIRIDLLFVPENSDQIEQWLCPVKVCLCISFVVFSCWVLSETISFAQLILPTFM